MNYDPLTELGAVEEAIALEHATVQAAYAAALKTERDLLDSMKSVNSYNALMKLCDALSHARETTIAAWRACKAVTGKEPSCLI